MRSRVNKNNMVGWMIYANLTSIILVAVLLIMVAGLFITNITTGDYKKIVENISVHVAGMMDEMDDGAYFYDSETGKLFKGTTEITDGVFWKIQDRDADVHHTIFWGDTRIMSDIKDASGNSVVGTKLTDQKIIKAVATDGIYTKNGVDIYGTKYSVCYYPIKNDGEIVGYVFTGVNQEKSIFQILVAVVSCLVISIVLAAVVAYVMIQLVNNRAKSFGANLSGASNIAEEKKNDVSELGLVTRENIEQINVAIDQVAIAVSKQAGNTEDIMSAMSEFADRIDTIMDRVRATSQVSGDSKALIDDLKNKVNTLTEVSTSNSNEILEISRQIEEDNNAVGDITKIINVINSIALQITLLSFNATVEAARAGEVGRGFAVVADSIKELSDQTKTSLEEITDIVNSITQKMLATTESSANLIKENEKVVKALDETRTQLNDVTGAFDDISDNLTEIMGETSVINDYKNRIIENVSSLAAASEENAAMGEEMKATSDEIINATDNLLKEIERLEEVSEIIGTVKTQFADNI